MENRIKVFTATGSIHHSFLDVEQQFNDMMFDSNNVEIVNIFTNYVNQIATLTVLYTKKKIQKGN